MIDLHSHVLYGMDDGAHTLEDSLNLLRDAQANGITDVIATSHVYPAVEAFQLERYTRHLQTLRNAALRAGLSLHVHSGGEIRYTDSVPRQLEQGMLPTLAGSRFVLIEFDSMSTFEQIERGARQIGNIGFIPVVAHCERCKSLTDKPCAAIALRRQMALRYQLDAETLIGRHPRSALRFLDALLAQDALDYIATDAHDRVHRPINLSSGVSALRRRCGDAQAQRIIENAGEVLSLGAV